MPGEKKDPHDRQRAHDRKAVFWLVCGVAGVIDYVVYLVMNPEELVASIHPLAGSIPVLYFISVYANYIGHRSASEANEAEINTPSE